MGIAQETKNALKPGDMVPGKGIFIGTFDLFDAYGAKLGIKTNWYDAAIELENPRALMTLRKRSLTAM